MEGRCSSVSRPLSTTVWSKLTPKMMSLLPDRQVDFRVDVDNRAVYMQALFPELTVVASVLEIGVKLSEGLYPGS
jgi:hypothetical protein